MERQYWVYILAKKKNGTLYIGMTNNLQRRMWEHKEGLVDGFSKKYQIHSLVHYEAYNDVQQALTREKRMKKWNREWKIQLIQENNPDWEDLSLLFNK